MFAIKETDYEKIMSNGAYAKAIINKAILKYPELFPAGIQEHGYRLKGKTKTSEKCGYNMIKIKERTENYQIRPSFLLPYGRGLIGEASKALLLMKYNQPFHVIETVLGKDDMYTLNGYNFNIFKHHCEGFSPEAISRRTD